MIVFVFCHASETLVLNMGELKCSTVFWLLELLHIVIIEMSQQSFVLVHIVHRVQLCARSVSKRPMLLSREKAIQVQMPKTLFKMIHEKCVK